MMGLAKTKLLAESLEGKLDNEEISDSLIAEINLFCDQVNAAMKELEGFELWGA